MSEGLAYSMMLTVIVLVVFTTGAFVALMKSQRRDERLVWALVVFLMGGLAGVGAIQYGLPRGWGCGPLSKGDWTIRCP